jgi:predicted hydrolase (HD superfamily)
MKKLLISNREDIVKGAFELLKLENDFEILATFIIANEEIFKKIARKYTFVEIEESFFKQKVNYTFDYDNFLEDLRRAIIRNLERLVLHY